MNPLEQLGLRDIHLPPPPGWWPPGPGWWLLLATLGLALVLAWLWHRRRRRLRSWRAARARLQQIRQDYANRPGDTRLLRQVSQWLRQVSLVRSDPHSVAGLQGSAWLAWLDQRLGGDEFSRGPGRILADGPYRREIAVDDVESLLRLCERWLKAARPGRD